jgi:hypothetical protein
MGLFYLCIYLIYLINLFIRWSGTEPTITEATYCLLYQPWMIDYDCGTIGEMNDLQGN